MIFVSTFYFCYMFSHHFLLFRKREMLHEVVFRACPQFIAGGLKSMVSCNAVCVARFLEYCHLS